MITENILSSNENLKVNSIEYNGGANYLPEKEADTSAKFDCYEDQLQFEKSNSSIINNNDFSFSNNEELNNKNNLIRNYYYQQDVNNNNNICLTKSESNTSSLADNIAEFAQQNYIYNENIPVSSIQSQINLHQNPFNSSSDNCSLTPILSREPKATENYCKFNVPSYNNIQLQAFLSKGYDKNSSGLYQHMPNNNNNYYHYTNDNITTSNYYTNSTYNNSVSYDMHSNCNYQLNNSETAVIDITFQNDDYYTQNFDYNNYENNNKTHREVFNCENSKYKNDESSIKSTDESDYNYKLPKLSTLFPSAFKTQYDLNEYNKLISLGSGESNCFEATLNNSIKKQRSYKRKKASTAKKTKVTQLTEYDEGSFESTDTDLNETSKKKRGRPKKNYKNLDAPLKNSQKKTNDYEEVLINTEKQQTYEVFQNNNSNDDITGSNNSVSYNTKPSNFTYNDNFFSINRSNQHIVQSNSFTSSGLLQTGSNNF